MRCFRVTNYKESSSSSSLPNVPYLPDEILLNCLARVSRLYYPTLSLVSKRFRTLLTSLELYKTRTLLSCTETCLYLCLSFSRSFDDPHWYTLCRRPTQNINHTSCSRCFTLCFNKKKDKNFMVSVPSNIYYPTRNINYPIFWTKLIAVGSNIYMFGLRGMSSCRVFCMDCRTHTWHEGPSSLIERTNIDMAVLDGKIYVTDTEITDDPRDVDLTEFFDTKTEKWGNVPRPSAEIRGLFVTLTLAINENLYIFGDKNLVYKPKENRWEAVEWDRGVFRYLRSCCVIDNVMYYYTFISSRKLKWYDLEERSGTVLKGLKKLVKLLKCKCKEYVKLVNYGGKLAVLWVEYGVNEKMIWCAEISLDKRDKEKIRGKVEWCHVVLTVPEPCHFEHFIAATV